jgi:putative membrane-bound dehydrogenase-like protein
MKTLLCGSLFIALAGSATAQSLQLHARSQATNAAGQYRPVEQVRGWNPRSTAIVICDMWDQHWCKGATERAAEMAPRMNETVKEARRRGVFVIHAPSETMEFYKNTPQRKRAEEAPAASTAEPLGKWRSLDRNAEGALPIDDSDGGCDDLPKCKGGPPYPWKRQIASIEIAPEDAITDRGQEVYNLLQQRKIDNVIVMGVHANMCVLGRSFAIRQLVKLGKNVVLMRDLTDTMYCSRMRPYVNHFRGNDLIVEHIEKYWCPSATSSDITGQPPFRFKEDVRPSIAFLISEDEYEAKDTVPEFARHELASRFGFQCSVIQGDSKTNLAGLDRLKGGDLAVFYMRRRALPDNQLSIIKAYVNAGKPVIGLRTASHGFQNWPEFDRDVLGGNYNNHHGKPKNGGVATRVTVAPDAADHPILAGWPKEEFGSSSWLYKVSPLAPTATPLLMGHFTEQPPEPVAWINSHQGGRVFYTSLGHRDDFAAEPFRRLLVNATLWAVGQLGPPPTNTVRGSSVRAFTPSATPDAIAGNKAVLEQIRGFKGRGQTVEAGEGAKPLAPAESLKRFKVPDDLQITLAAAEPDVRQPVCINFDARGRMWVVQYLQYPFPAGLKVIKYDEHLRAQFDKVPAPPPNHMPGADRVTIFEDKDNDGYYESQKDFVTGLNIATSALPGEGGVWVMNPPYLLFYPDKNTDDVPDGPPEVRLSGFGLEDTHAVANSLTWGPDGWLYGAQGSTCTATINGVRFLGQAIWRYHPATKVFELYAEGGGNTFCVEFDSKGRVYSGTNWDKHRGLHFVQGGYYVKNWGKHGPLTNPHAYGFFPHMSHEGDTARFSHSLIIYEGDGLPKKYRGKMFSVVPLKNRVQISEMLKEGSTFYTRDADLAAQTDDKWFRPVDIKAGPDGAIYLADWYDVRLTHVDPRDNWDRSNGRIWRISGKQADRPRPRDLSRLSSEELIAALSHKDKWVRQQAVRLISEVGRGVPAEPRLTGDGSPYPALRKLLEANAPGALEALWALHLLGGFDDSVALKCLDHPGEDIRTWAVRLLGECSAISPAVQTRLEELARYESAPRVRSQLASSVRRWSGPAALPIVRELAQRADDSKDPHIPLLLWWAIENKAISDRDLALSFIGTTESWKQPLIAQHLIHRLAQRYASEGSRPGLECVATLMRQAPDENARGKILEALAEAFKGRRPADIPAVLREEVAKTPAKPDLLIAKLRLGAVTKSELAELLKLAGDEAESVKPRRIATLEALGETRTRDALQIFLDTARTSKSHSVRRAALSALQHFEDLEIAGNLIHNYRDFPPEHCVRAQVLGLLSKRQEWAGALMQAIDAGRIKPQEFSFDVIERLRLYKEPEIAAKVAKHWSNRRQTPVELQARMSAIAKLVRDNDGDENEGREVFSSLCASCHKLHGEGQTIGPELTGYERDNMEFMLLGIVDPNAAIREEYTNFELETSDGLLLTGFVVERAAHSVTIEDGEQGRVTVDKSKIKSLKASPMSRMPEGLLDALSEKQTRDLFAYLRSPGPVAAGK